VKNFTRTKNSQYNNLRSRTSGWTSRLCRPSGRRCERAGIHNHDRGMDSGARGAPE
jgi:hypothetical protein